MKHDHRAQSTLVRTPRRRFGAALVAALLCQACTSTMYQGETRAATAHVDVYRSDSEVTRPHRTMGVITTNAAEFMSAESIEMELVSQAKRRGADAIVVDSISMETIGYRIDDSSGSRRYVKAGNANSGTSGDAGSTAIVEKAVTARLLTYTR